MGKISLNTPVSELNLPKRCISHYYNGWPNTLRDVVSNPKIRLYKIRHIGKSVMSMWDDFLEENGLHFDMSESEMDAYESSLNNGDNADSDIQVPVECATISEVGGDINWEQREWELATQIFRDSLAKENLTLCYIDSAVCQGEKAIKIAKAFIDKYKEDANRK